MQYDNFLSSDEAHELLKRYSAGASWMKHCVAVSSLATFFSKIFTLKYPVNIEYLQAASLLHDIGRYKTHDPIMHGIEGYKLLSGLGHMNEAFICASHVFYGISSSEAIQYGLPKSDFVPISFEERLIPLVDFLVEHDRPVLLNKRFASLRNRNRDNALFLLKLGQAEQKANALMMQLNSEFNISMEELAGAFFDKRSNS